MICSLENRDFFIRDFLSGVYSTEISTLSWYPFLGAHQSLEYTGEVR